MKNIKIEDIIKLRKEGKSYEEIAKSLNCNKSNIYKRYKRYEKNYMKVNEVNYQVNDKVNDKVNDLVNEVNDKVIEEIVKKVALILKDMIISEVSKLVNDKVNEVNEKVNEVVNEVNDLKQKIQKIEQSAKEKINEVNDKVNEVNDKISGILLINNINNSNKKTFTNKENINIKEKDLNKEILIEANDSVFKVQIPKKVKEPQPAIKLIFDFANLVGIEKVDSGYIKKNIVYAHQLLKEHSYEEILGLVNWINNNSDYWAGKVTNLAVVYKYFSEWMLDFNQVKEKKFMNVKQWLAKHPEYIPQSPKETIERYRELLRAFNLALKDKNVIPTQEEWQKYRLYREKLMNKINEN